MFLFVICEVFNCRKFEVLRTFLMENQPQPQPPPVLDTLRKVDQAMARLQEIQCTIAGGSILCGGVALSPRSSRGYLRTSLRCKQESLRMKELAMIVDEETNLDKGQQIVRSSSLRRSSSNGEWRRWSTPAFLIQQAVGEIMEASNLTKEVAHLVSNSIEDKPTESPKSAQNSLNGKSVVEEHNESSYHSNVKHSVNETEMQHTEFGEKDGLQTFGPNLPENPVHSFKVIYKDTSTLKHHGKIEKEEYATRVRAESPNSNTRFQRQVSFRASDQVQKEGKAKKLPSSLPVSHCSSPVRLIREKTISAKPLVKVEEIKPAPNSWMFRSNSTKAIKFPNSAFVPSPSKNNQENTSTNASMKRNSLHSVKDLKSLRTTDYPCNKEEHSGIFMVAYSPTVRKPSSLSRMSRMSRSSSTKATVFSNSGFAPSPLKNNQEVKSASMKRNSLPSVKELKSVTITNNPCNKEERGMVGDSPTVRKSSSFSWISRSSSTKAIMAPNSAFVFSPLKNNLQVKSTNASMKRNSLPSVKDLKSSRFADYPCNKAGHSEVCMVADSPTVRKSSSLSWIPRSSSTKAIMFPNPAFVSSPFNNPQLESAKASVKRKRNSLPSVKELESLRITDFPCNNKEDHSEVRMVADSPTVRKSSSFSWMSRSSSTKAVMFPNPAFVSSPSRNNPEVKSTNASMKTNSLPFVKDLKSLRSTDYPCNKEEHTRVCTVADSPTVRKSSSFSAAYQPSASKLTKQSPMSSLLNRTLKKFHVIKTSAPGSPQTPSEFDAKIKFEAAPGLEKSASLRFVSSSQKQDYLVRRHSMASCDPSAESKVSRLSKQPIKALVQLPKKISSVILHPHSVPQVGDFRNESSMTSEAGEGHRTRKLSEILASSAEAVRKQGAKRVENHNMQSNLPIVEGISVNEMQHGRHVQKCNSPLNYTKERHLKPISINSSVNSSSRHDNNTGSLQDMLYATPSKDILKKQKIKLQRKENSDNEEDKGMKKSTGFLRNSWSFTPDNTRSSHKEKLDAATGRLPFLKNVKEWVTLQRSASSFNR